MKYDQLFPMKQAEPLKARKADTEDERQFWVEGMSEGRSFDDQYVAFSGYFGAYNPNTFAAAPEMLEALKALDDVGVLNPTGSKLVSAAVAKMRSAIAKAEKRS